MSDPFIAQIQIFPYTFAPRDWAFCQGSVMQIAQNTALFSLVGTTYGGDGRITFDLPNLIGRVPMHYGGSTAPGLSPTNLGFRDGSPTIQLGVHNLPTHTHTASGLLAAGTQDSPANQFVAADSSPAQNYYRSPTEPLIQMSEHALSTAGASQAHENRQPYLALNFMIALDGTYPSRN